MKKLLAVYCERITEQSGAAEARNIYETDSAGAVPFSTGAVSAHLLWMLGHMPSDAEKFNRWLGFIQGVLWLKGAYNLNELRQQMVTVALEAEQERLKQACRKRWLD